jgi:hypothetical protein
LSADHIPGAIYVEFAGFLGSICDCNVTFRNLDVVSGDDL